MEYGGGINQRPSQTRQAKKRYAMLPDYLIQVLSLGEKSGQLDQLLDTLIENYQQNFNHLIEVSMSLIEPLLIVFLGLFAGLLLLAVYLPLFNLGSLF